MKFHAFRKISLLNDLQNLPEGWEEVVDRKGNLYYANHGK
jgi:hypothetical protein